MVCVVTRRLAVYVNNSGSLWNIALKSQNMKCLRFINIIGRYIFRDKIYKAVHFLLYLKY